MEIFASLCANEHPTNYGMTLSPELLVIGHVTRDLFDGEARLGGAAAYAAQAAATLGIQTALVTAAPQNCDLLESLRKLPSLSLCVKSSFEVTTFEIGYPDAKRRLVCRSMAEPIVADDIPVEWRKAPATYLALVVNECAPLVLRSLSSKVICVALQGWMRRMEVDGTVQPDAPHLTSAFSRALHAAVFSEEDHPEAQRLAEELAVSGLTVALTRSFRGASLMKGSQRWDIPAAPADEVDPTGAGDVFGMMMTLALSRGAMPQEAVRLAAAIAARVVEGSGLGKLNYEDSRYLPPSVAT